MGVFVQYVPYRERAARILHRGTFGYFCLISMAEGLLLAVEVRLPRYRPFSSREERASRHTLERQVLVSEGRDWQDPASMRRSDPRVSYVYSNGPAGPPG
jgi:hypothetical protein